MQQRRGPFLSFFPRCDVQHGTLGHGAARGAAPEGALESVVHLVSLWRDNKKANTYMEVESYVTVLFDRVPKIKVRMLDELQFFHCC